MVKRLGLFKAENERFFELCEVTYIDNDVILEWREIKYNSEAYDLIIQCINAMKAIDQFTILK